MKRSGPKRCEERAQLLKEARDTRDKIINDGAKDQDQKRFEYGKIIADAKTAIEEQQKMAALTEVEEPGR